MSLTGKQQAFAKYMYTLGSESFGNGVESAKKANYKGSYGTLNQIARDNLQKPILIAEKQRIQAETEQIMDINRETCVKKLQAIANTGTVRNQLTAISLIGDFCGFKRENAPNAERERAKLARMSDEERKIAQAMAQLRTEQEAGDRPNTIKIA